MATLPLKASHREQRSAIYFLWAKDFAQIPFTLIYVQYNMVTSVLQDQQYESVVAEKDLADVLFQRLIQRSQQSHLSYGLTGVYQ